jgi:hypothetical protein
MKNLNINRLFWTLFLSVFAIISLSSCRDDSSDDSKAGPPVIEKITGSLDGEGKPVDLTPITQAQANNTVIIHGSGFKTLQHVYFNGTESAFNPNFVSDNTIIVNINPDTPYANTSNKLKLVTAFGETIYDFVVAPPAPVLKSFNAVNANAGETITIYGNYFVNPEVKFGTTKATVTSSTLTEIKVVVPANSNNKYITVSTISGDATSAYATGTAIFDDAFYSPWTIEDWNNHTFETGPNAEQGTVCIKKTMDAWGNLQGNWGWDDKISNYKGIRIAIKAEKAGKLKFIFNGDWSERVMLDVTTEWKTFIITWDQVGNADHVQNISFQNFTKENGDGVANTFYIDNIGYALK